MNSKHAKVTKNQIETYILPLIPPINVDFLARLICQKLYNVSFTGIQWNLLFVDIENINPPFFGSWFTIIIANGLSWAFSNRCLSCI